MTLTLNDSSLIKTQSYIDGHWVDADSGETLAVTNPATNETLLRWLNAAPQRPGA